MGQKVHPHGLRVGIFRKWNTTWFVNKNNYLSTFFAQQYLETFLKSFFHFYSYTKNSASKKVSLVDLKWFRTGKFRLYFFIFFYKFRSKKRRWGIVKAKRKPQITKKYIKKITLNFLNCKRQLKFFKY